MRDRLIVPYSKLNERNEAPTLSWKLYIYILQPKTQVLILCNVRLMYYPGNPILNRPTPKKDISKVKSHRLLYMHSIIMPYR